MTERLTGLEVQAQLLAEARRTRQAVEAIRTLLNVACGLVVIGLLVWFFIAVSR